MYQITVYTCITTIKPNNKEYTNFKDFLFKHSDSFKTIVSVE